MICRGDLEKQRVDALVSSDDELPKFDAGVSAAIRRHTGPALEKGTQRRGSVRVGRAVVTSPGNFPARFIFHAVTIGSESRSTPPSQDIIHEIMESCFYHADALGLKSIAFPLLGAGAGRFSRQDCLDTMFRFLCRKFLRQPTSVQAARIVIRP
jgi:O-acetyl-ADP-ribose deacetylase (regulator of RNase III)